ncbi:MAG: hypothetical protein D6715_14275 [Calditrichaeota bacterium]|nr:MAG: hypothetical protein D6715_14275 [Calditrichota bacterium]
MVLPAVDIHPDYRSRVKLGLLAAGPVRNAPSSVALWEDLERLAAAYRNRFADHNTLLAALQPARQLYRSLGLEPTRYRPSSEALLRRILKNKPLYRINLLVDAGNFCALRFLLPIGLYDQGVLQGKVVLRPGRPGETYRAIGKGEMNLQAKPVLADEQGPFGNPSADSERSSLTLKTEQILMVIFAPAFYAHSQLQSHLAFAENTFRRFGAAENVQIAIIG